MEEKIVKLENIQSIPTLMEKMHETATKLAIVDARSVLLAPENEDTDDDEMREYVTKREDFYLECMLRMAGFPQVDNDGDDDE